MLKALRGTKDILPGEIALWKYIEDSARDIFGIYNYKEIRTPIIEEASLFVRSIGETTDIVQKEMYIFPSRSGTQIALRPEATASIVRAYLENSLFQNHGIAKLFYIGPMFRSERPQKGRQRQFHQLGAEAIGSCNPFLDSEVISMAINLLEKIGIKKFHVMINSLGCQKDKLGMINQYREHIRPHLESLCDECNARFEKNVLRILDCKERSCQDIVRKIALSNLLCSECASHFEAVKKGLDILGIQYTLDPKIVRGLDYYTRTVFEIVQDDLGSKDAISAGGRYNNLIKEMGGEDTPAIGFAFGIERLIMAYVSGNNIIQPDAGIDVFVAVIEGHLYNEAFRLTNMLREKGISCEIEYDRKTLKAQMRSASRMSARFVVIFGEEEFKKNKVMLRDMKSSSQKEIAIDDVMEEINLAV